MNQRVVLSLFFITSLWSGLGAQVVVEPAFPNLNFTRPVDLQHAGDQSNRLFVVEQAGVIQVFENLPGVATKTVFLDIRDLVRDSDNEEGLLGLAFHPRFKENGYFFVNHTASNPRRTVIARFKVDAADSNRADRDSMLVILEFDQPFGNHNGGQIAFGPDSCLYIAVGDGGSGGDPQNHGQNRSTLLGSILRINIDSKAPGLNYAIPADNPFVGNGEGFREEIYAFGLRNPWRISFDPPTGRLWAGDVGQGAREEIDLIENGKNYGWRIMEGTLCHNPSSNCDMTGLELPVWEYGRSLGRSITGGYVYRGQHAPDLVGAYVYGDFVSGRIWSLRVDGVGPVNTELLDTSLSIASFGVDAAGNLYICAFDGRIYEIRSVITSVVNDSPNHPATFELGQNHPNPFRMQESPETHFELTIPTQGEASIQIFNLKGQLIRELLLGVRGAGSHAAAWDGRGYGHAPLSSGAYFYRLVVDGVGYQTGQMHLIR